jgi:transcriptional regulator with XRE-family HTH domain
MLSRYETGTRAPHLESLDAVLRALGVDLRALADALDSADGRTPPVPAGQPRQSWVEGLRQRGVDRDVLFGFAYGALSGDDPQAEADLVASAEEAARLIATAVLDERRALELERELEVAEPKAPYGSKKPARPR